MAHPCGLPHEKSKEIGDTEAFSVSFLANFLIELANEKEKECGEMSTVEKAEFITHLYTQALHEITIKGFDS